MATMRWLVPAAAGLALCACSGPPIPTGIGYSIPTPTYALVKDPPPYRVGADGLRVDNSGVQLDQAGYRIDNQGQRTGVIEVNDKTTSNPMAGFYISSIGTTAGGSVMAPSAGAGVGVGSGPGSANPAPSGMEVPPPETQPKK